MPLTLVQNLTSSSFAVPPPVARVLRAGGSCEVDLTEAQLSDSSLRKAESSGFISLTAVVEPAIVESGVKKEDIFIVKSYPTEEIESGVPGVGIGEAEYSIVLFERVIAPHTAVFVDLVITSSYSTKPRNGYDGESTDATYRKVSRMVTHSVDNNIMEDVLHPDVVAAGEGDIATSAVVDGISGVFKITATGARLESSQRTYSRGIITCISGNRILQGEKFTISDGVGVPVDFVFDKNSSVVQTGTTRRIAITDATTTQQVVNLILAALGFDTNILNVYRNQGYDLDNSVYLPQVEVAGAYGRGEIDNVPMTETVSDTGFSVTGLSGGLSPLPGLMPHTKYVVRGTYVVVSDMGQSVRLFDEP